MKTRILINEGEYRLTKAGVMDAHIDAEMLITAYPECAGDTVMTQNQSKRVKNAQTGHRKRHRPRRRTKKNTEAKANTEGETK
jgi:hypothetical protein